MSGNDQGIGYSSPEDVSARARGAGPSSDRGSILISVLWSLFFLAALALVISVSITPQLGLAARLRDRVILRYLAQAGFKRAVIELREDETEDYDALNEPWSHNEEAFKEIDLTEEGYFSIEYLLEGGEDEESLKRYGLIDEERKINVNTVPASVLKQFFEIVGETSSQEATDIADSMIDWRDDDDEPLDNGAEHSYYEALDDAYPCKNAAFEILEELLLVKGMTQTIFDKVKDRLTVYGGGMVNINTADMEVLRSLGMRDTLAEKIILFREGSDGQEATKDDPFFDNAQSAAAALSAGGGLSPEEMQELNAVVQAGLIGTRSDCFRGYALGGFRDRDISARIVFVIDRDEKIRYWREE